MNLPRALLTVGMAWFLIGGCFGTSSGDGDSFVPTGNIIAVAERGGGNVDIKVGGTEGSVPSGSTVEVTNLETNEMQTTTANPDGSFDPTFTGNTDDMFRVVVTENGEVTEDITIGVTTLRSTVNRNIARLGSVPTAIEIRNDRAYVVNGFSDNIQIFDLNQNPPDQIGTVVLPPGSNPMSMAFLNDTIAYVANFTGQSVAEINLQTRQCVTLIRQAGVSGETTPCQNVITVGGVFLEDPSGTAIVNGKLYVTNNNLDEFFNPAGNGIVTVINTETNQFIRTIEASGSNTGGATIINGDLYIVNGGITLFNMATGFTCDLNLPPSIDIINPETDSVVETIPIPLSSENPLVCSPGGIEPTPDERFGYLGLGLVGALLKVDLQTNTLVRGPANPIIVTGLSGLNFTADVEIRADGLGFTSLFNTDQISVFDTATDEVNPFPFIDFLPAGLRADDPDSSFFDGVQSLAIRSGIPGIDFTGADVFYITGLSEQLGSVDTTRVLPVE